MSRVIPIKKLRTDAIVPSQPYTGDAGFDLHTVETVTFAPMEFKRISTGIAMAIPVGYAGLIWDKSGIATGNGLKTLGGVVDAGYRGEILVGMINLSPSSFIFKKGEKVAQILIQKVEAVILQEADDLADTHRGEKGFGSSGT